MPWRNKPNSSLNSDMTQQQTRLIEIFERINDAHIKSKQIPNHVADLVEAMHSGRFFELPEAKRTDWLACMDMVYLGRGECIWGFVESGTLPKDFPDDMRLATMMYYLTLDCFDEEHKDRLRKRIADIINK